MTRVRTVIVDDEPPARAKLRAYLERHAELEIVGEAGDGVGAVEVIERALPDLVFLDIQMPELDGFEVVGALHANPMPEIVFVTAYEQHALKAFEIGALDYLLKPVTAERFAAAVARAVQRIRSERTTDLVERVQRALEGAAVERPRLERFLVKERDRSRFVALADVERIEAAGNYLELHTRQGAHLVRGTMKEVERRLDPARFARIHRTTIINLDKVKYLEPWSHGDQVVILESGAKVMLSRRYRDRLPPSLIE